MPTVGYGNRTRYWQIYAFQHPPEGYVYKRALDIPLRQLNRYLKRTNQFLANTKFFLPFQGCDLYHTYNGIVPGPRPWVAEVESLLPRYGNMPVDSRLYQWAVNRIRSKWCRALIYTSEYTRSMNQPNMEKWGVDPDKQYVVYRAVEPLGSKLNGSESELHVVFVGNGFYRKGGLELLKAFERIPEKDIKLTIVSSFEIDWAIYPSIEQQEYVKRCLSRDNRIFWYENVPHSEVEQIMQKGHVYVNTTFADTFNNSILEAMSCGMSIISSDIRAIPEFVYNGENGFTTSISHKDREEVVDFIEDRFRTYLHDSDLRKKHGQRSLNIVKENFTVSARI